MIENLLLTSALLLVISLVTVRMNINKTSSPLEKFIMASGCNVGFWGSVLFSLIMIWTD